MKTLTPQVANEIKDELENIPEKYQKDFNSAHEGLAVIQEEFEELKHEVFFGEKQARYEAQARYDGAHVDWNVDDKSKEIHRERMRKEAVQIAAMCVRSCLRATRC